MISSTACFGSAYNLTDSCRPRGSDWIANGNAATSPESQTIFQDESAQRRISGVLVIRDHESLTA